MPSKPKSCKVCRDAGKSEKDYSSHNVKNKKGNVICPTLLAQECKTCKQKGHTVKYCPLVEYAMEELRKNWKQMSEAAAAAKKNRPASPSTPPPPTPTSSPKTSSAKKFSYADIVAERNNQAANTAAFNAFVKKHTAPKPKVKHSWASESSSDSEDDDEQISVTSANTQTLKKVLNISA